MNKIATAIKMGAAASAIAASAALVQAPAAQAAPVVPAPTFLGAALGSAGCLVPVFDPGQCATGPAATLGNIFYLGPVDSTPPPRVDFFHFNPAVPLALIPVLGPALAGWFNSLNIEICVGGLSARIGGPYNTGGGITASLGSGC